MNKKNKIEYFKQICLYDLNQASIISDIIPIYYGSDYEDISFDFIIKDAKGVIVTLGKMADKNEIENQIEYLEDKIIKQLLDYDVFIYSMKHDKIMYVSPYREWLEYDFKDMGMTPKAFIKRLKYSHEELKLEDDLEFDRVKEELNHLKKINSENEKKYVKLKEDSVKDNKYYYEKIKKFKLQSSLIEKNEISRLKYELKKINSKIDIFNPLKKLILMEKRGYFFNFQKDEIILKVDLWSYFEGGKDEVAFSYPSGSKYYILDLDKKEYLEVDYNKYSDITNWLQFDIDYELLN